MKFKVPNRLMAIGLYVVAASTVGVLFQNCGESFESMKTSQSSVDGQGDGGGNKVYSVECPIDPSGPPDLLSKTCYSAIKGSALPVEIMAYEPVYPLWTNGAAKLRHIYLPKNSKIDNSDPDNWVFPQGTILFKEFSLNGKRLETRILEKIGSGTGKDAWRASMYIWRADQSDAELITAEKEAALKDNSNFVPSHVDASYYLPSRTSCNTCHSGSADMALGFSSLQLSGAANAKGHVDFEGLRFAKLLTDLNAKENRIPGSLADQKAMGYIHANCASCHNPIGSAADRGLFLNHLAGAQDIKDQSTYKALGERGFLTAANPTANNVIRFMADGYMPKYEQPAIVDQDAIAMLTNWIDGLDGVADTTPSGLLVISGGTDFNFGSVDVGSSQQNTFMVKAEGRNLSGITYVPTAPFSRQGGTCGATLAKDATCTLIVSFTPAAEMNYSGSLKINYTADVAKSITVGLIGAGRKVEAAEGSIQITGSGSLGSLTVGQEVSRDFAFTNTGVGTAYAVSLTVPAEVTATFNNCNGNLATGTKCAATIKWKPSSAGPLDTVLRVTYKPSATAAAVSRNISLTGNAVAKPNPALLQMTDVPAYSFGTVESGKSAQRQFTITNVGDTTATAIKGLSLTAPFSIVSQTCALTSLGKGGSCTITVSFAPVVTVATNFSTNVGLTYFDGNVEKTISSNLTGSATPVVLPTGLVGPAVLDFGSAVVHSVTNKVAIFKNTSGQTISAIQVDTLSIYPFELINRASSVPDCRNVAALAPESSCSLNLSWKALPYDFNRNINEVGKISYQLGADVKRKETTIELRATANANGVPLIWPPEFGSSSNKGVLSEVEVGTKKTFTLTFKNVGTVNATNIIDDSIYDENYYRSGGTCGRSLASGATCTLTVTFAPTFPGETFNYIRFVYRSTSNPTTEYSSGVTPIASAIQTGTPAPARLVARVDTSTNLGPVQVKVAAVLHSVSFYNLGGTVAKNIQAKLVANGIGTVPMSNFSVSNNCTGELKPSQATRCSIGVVFRPTQPGLASADLIVTYDNGSGPAAPITLRYRATGVATATPNLEIRFHETPVKLCVGCSFTNDFTILNRGNATANIDTFSYTNVNEDYVILTGYPVGADDLPECHTMTRLAPGKGCTQKVLFMPKAVRRSPFGVTINAHGATINDTTSSTFSITNEGI